jgi:hypothetical protein
VGAAEHALAAQHLPGREIERCTVGVTKVVFDTYLPAHSNSEVGQNEVSKLTSFRSNGGEKGREEFGH